MESQNTLHVSLNFITRKLVLLLFLILGSGLSFSQTNKNLLSAQDTVPNYSFVKLKERYGKEAAELIQSKKIDVGFTHAMVRLSIGKPYLIEEPMGINMDYEIHYYKTYIVFYEFGVVTHYRHIPAPK